MELKVFLIFVFSILKIASSQSISCNFYTFYNRYKCDLSINNSIGFDEFPMIDGIHEDGKTNNDVVFLEIIAGNTSIIPRVICDSFQSLETFNIHIDVGLEGLSENSLVSCNKLKYHAIIFNPVTEIHPNYFRYNLDLEQLFFRYFPITSIPEELFSTTTQLQYLNIQYMNLLNDLPANIFKNNPLMNFLSLDNNALNAWRPEWTQSLTKLDRIFINLNNFSEIPRNVTNSEELYVLFVGQNQVKVVDYFMFNAVGNIDSFSLRDSPVEAVDFNLIDMSKRLMSLDNLGWPCFSEKIDRFDINREENMAKMEPCFAAFDKRTLAFSTTGTDLTFNSIRKEEIHVQIQAASDAIIRFASNPDGSGSNFEVKIGDVSCIYENDIQRTCSATPGILNDDKSFTIMWSGGFVEVLHGNPLLFYNLESPFKVRFYGVGTSSGSSASWFIE